MRIIAGKNRGTKLNSLEGNDITRPTLDRVKESLFSILSPRLENSQVLDLFSGTGALALESVSRGASKAIICDKSYKAIKVITENIAKTKTEDKTYIIHNDFEKALKLLYEKGEKLDIIFLDPPYKTDYVQKAVIQILKYKLLADDGIVVIETDEEERIINGIEDIEIDIFDKRKYGRVSVIFLRQK